MTVENGLTPKTARYNRSFLVKKNDKFKTVNNNEFIYNPMNMTLGAVDLNSTGKTVAVSGYYITMITKPNFDSKYFNFWLKSAIAIKNYKIYATGSLIERQRIQFPTLSQIKTKVPSISEQQRIGNILMKLDRIITLHQRKINTLENLRKAYSYVMFSNNNNTPLVRFRGFHEKWDSKKLNHYLTTSKEKNLNGAYDKMDVLSVSGVHGVVNQIKFQGRSFAGKTVLNYGVLYNGDIVYTKSPLKVAPHGIIKANKGSNGIVSTLYAIYKTKETAHPSFVQTYFENDLRLNKYLKPLVNKGAKNDMKVTDENVLNGLVSFPILEEQMKIALFDEEIENMIEVNQIKINTMKKLKDIYFRKMFL